ncbi:AAA family ATPase [Flaviaesturariibacter terrae]
MIITKLEIENFMCYAGYNCFEFKEGLNIIIGDNGYGKSKLYDAFYWVLYDECFDTNKKAFVKTNFLKSSIVSDKAKHECEVDSKVVTSVKITFYNPEKDNEFTLERKYSIAKLEDGWREGAYSDLTIWKKELSYLNSNLVTDEAEKDRIRKTILPDNIKPYMWFQGEQVESIIDFNKEDTLNQAINILSNITKFDSIKEIAKLAAKAAKNEYQKEAKRLSTDKKASDDLEKQRERAEGRLNHFIEEEQEAQRNLLQAEEKFERLLNKMEDAQKIKSLESERRQIQYQLEEQKKHQSEGQVSFHGKLFKNRWVLKGTEHLFEKYSEKFSEYETNKLQKQAEIKARAKAEGELIKKLQTRLPIDVPEPIYVERMLKEERCLVCDREALKDSEAWNKIKELIDRPQEKVKQEDDVPSKHNFQAEFRKLYQTGVALSYRVKGIDEDLTNTLFAMQNVRTKIKELNKQYEHIDSEIQRALNDSSIKVKDADDILNEIAINDKYRTKYRDELMSIRYSIATSKKEIEEIDKKLKDLVVGAMSQKLVEKLSVLEDFELVTSSTRDRVFNELIQKLEEEANKHYSSMTEGNLSVRGQIRLRKTNINYMPELVNADGNVLPHLNTGNIILIKLATIMAIISARQGSRATDLYTLITDAPMSVFGEDYTIGFCKTVSKVYKQSIIMSKEFYKNEKLRKELLESEEIHLGKVYLIMPTIDEHERTSRNSLATKLQPLA